VSMLHMNMVPLKYQYYQTTHCHITVFVKTSHQKDTKLQSCGVYDEEDYTECQFQI
jgi:hypothetical protein